MKKFAFIINPAAGKIKASNVSQLIKSQSNKYNVASSLFYTEKRNHAIEICDNLTKSNEYDTIVAVGGDGTVNEVINGFHLESNSTLGVLPYGSGNDIGRYLFQKKVNDYFDILFRDESQEIAHFDVGVCKIKQHDETFIERKFINAVGIGFDAYVAYLNQYDKKLSGISSYIIAVFRALKSLTNLETQIEIDGKILDGKYLLITVGNGKTSGGGFYLNPDADPTDGILNLTTIDEGSRLEVVMNLPFALINKLGKVKLVNFHLTKELKIRLKNPYYVHLDGEIGSINALEFTINFEKNKLKIIKSI